MNVGKVVDKITAIFGGGLDGSKQRAKTLLQTDEKIALYTILTPLLVIAIMTFNNTGSFSNNAIGCATSVKLLNKTWQTSTNQNYFYHNAFCWYHPYHWNVNGTIRDESFTDIYFHTNFPYFCLLLSMILSIPTVLWTSTYNRKSVFSYEIERKINFLNQNLTESIGIMIKSADKLLKQNDIKKCLITRNNTVIYEKWHEQIRKDQENLYKKFKTFHQFIQKEMVNTSLKKKILIYRTLVLSILTGCTAAVYFLSLKKPRSEFNCKVEYPENEFEVLRCTVREINVRIFLSWIWFDVNILLIIGYVMATYFDIKRWKSKSEQEFFSQHTHINEIIYFFTKTLEISPKHGRTGSRL